MRDIIIVKRDNTAFALLLYRKINTPTPDKLYGQRRRCKAVIHSGGPSVLAMHALLLHGEQTPGQWL